MFISLVIIKSLQSLHLPLLRYYVKLLMKDRNSPGIWRKYSEFILIDFQRRFHGERQLFLIQSAFNGFCGSSAVCTALHIEIDITLTIHTTHTVAHRPPGLTFVLYFPHSLGFNTLHDSFTPLHCICKYVL